jgi:CHAT domain-containing protein
MNVQITTVRALLATLIVTVYATGPPALADAPQESSQAGREVRAAIDEGRFVDAERQARALLASFGGLAGENPTAAMSAGDLLLDALIENGRGGDQETQDLAHEMLRRRQATSPDDRPALAASLGHLGVVLFRAGEYRRAALELEKACVIRENASLANDSAAAADFGHLAMALLKLGRDNDALTASNRAVAIAASLANHEISTPDALNIRGFVWQWKGDYSRSRTDLERAFAIQQTTRARHPSTAMTLMLLGTQYQLEGDSVRARDFLERAVSLAEETLRPDHPNIAWFVRVLAVPVQDLGDLARARALQERATALAVSSVGSGHPLTADCLQDLAGTLLLQADFEGARSRYENALAIYQRRLGSDSPETAMVVYNLALLNADLGDFARARELHRRAIAAWERTFGRDHAFVARGLWEFGQTLADQRLDREAVPLFERALAIRRRTLGNNNVAVAETLSSVASSLARLGESQRALSLSTQAMNIWEKAASPDTAGFVRSLLAHAGVLSARGEIPAAIEAYDRALRIQLPALGPAHPDIALIEVSRASLLAQVDRQQESLTLALHAEETGRQHLSLTLGSLPERQALDYAAKRPQGLGLALSLVTAERAASVLDAVVRGRSLVLDEIALRRRASSHETGGPTASLWTALRQARERLANLVIRGPGSQRPEQFAALVGQAQQQKEDAERALAEQSATFRLDVSRADVGLDDVKKHLPADSALVSIVRYDRRDFASVRRTTTGRTQAPRTEPSYLAFVLGPGPGEPAIVLLGAAAVVEAQVTRWRQAMIAELAPRSDVPRSGPSFASVGFALRRQIWDPIAAHVGHATHVFVVPDGAFNLVPLAALPSGRGRYLVEDGPLIHYLSAERDLVADEMAPATSGSGMLSVGGAAFSDGSSFAAVRNARPGQRSVQSAAASDTGKGGSSPSMLTASASLAGSEPAARSLRDVAIDCSSFRQMRFGALPASRNEAQAVAGLWRRFNVERGVEALAPQTLTGADATERTFKQMAPGLRILHLATHGFFLGDDCAPVVEGTRAVGGLTSPSAPTHPRSAPKQAVAPRAIPENPLLLSGLALAGANRRSDAGTDEDDGILTAEEVSALNLEGVEWAVLSACNTGLGTVVSREGVLGLRRAFQVAGVRTVIMSLWSVDDRATLQWMERLYEARFRQNLSTVEAVRDASVRVLRDRRARRQSTNPFFWAAFVASGDWH